MVEQRVKGGANRAAGVEDVVHQYDVFALHRKRDLGGADHRLDIHRGEIVTIEIDIENADRDRALLQCLDLSSKPLRQRDAAPADADEGQLVQVFTLLQNFVGQAYQRTIDFGRTHQL